MNKTETLKLARKAYDVLHALLGYSRDMGVAYNHALHGERRHRCGDFARYHPGAASAPACAELFVARWIAEYALKPETMPSIADIGRLRPDVLQCASIVQNATPEKVLAVLRAADIDPEQVAALDYVTAIGKART